MSQELPDMMDAVRWKFRYVCKHVHIRLIFTALPIQTIGINGLYLYELQSKITKNKEL